MTNLVEFPNLGLTLDVNRVAFTVFGTPIYWYGVLIGLGMLLAVLFAFWQAPRCGISVDRMIDVIFIGFVLAIIGGRAYYVLFVDAQYRTFFDLINLRGGGIAIYGAIIGAFVGALLGCKLRRVPVLPMFDVVGMGFLIGQGIGRWGNFFNQEAFGDNTAGLFGMISPATIRYLETNQTALAAKGILVDPTAPVHPTFLYESLWCLLGFLLIFLYSKRRKFNGELFLFYVIWYGAGRFVIEGMRTDPLMIGTFRVSQLLALTSAAAAFVIWVIARVRTAGKPLVIPEIPPQQKRVRIDTPTGPETVVITWPGDTPAPSKGQMQAMALTVWEAEQAGQGKPVDEKPAEDQPAEPAGAEPKAEDTPKPAKKPAAKKPAAKKAAPKAAVAAKVDESASAGDNPAAKKAPAKKPAAKKPAGATAKKSAPQAAAAKKPAAKKPAAKKPGAGDAPAPKDG